MPRLLSTLTVMATLAIAGCGGGGGGDEASSPLDEALRYLPADTPFAVAIDTDTDGEQYKAAGDIADRFGLGKKLVEQIEESLDAEPGEIDRLEKALGNEFVVGSTDTRAFINDSSKEDDNFVGAIQASSREALDGLLKEEGLKEQGESNGATLYKDDDGDQFAIKGETLIVAGDKKQLDAALATREGDDSLTEEDFEDGIEGVASDALIRVYLNVEELLSVDPDAKEALKSKWVRSLTTGGIALVVEDDEVAIDFNLKTDGEDLTEEDLPIAAGSEAPQVIDRSDGDVALSLRDPAQILEFAQATAKSIDPQGFSNFEVGKKQIERRLGIDLEEDFFGQMKDGLAVTGDIESGFGIRAELEDPREFEQTLEKMSSVLPDLAEGAFGQKVGFVKPKPGEDFYALATADQDQVVFGVVGDVFVLSNKPAIAGSLGDDGMRSVPGAAGSVVLSVDAEQIGELVLGLTRNSDLGIVDRIKGEIGMKPLDELNGSLEASTDALSGSFKLTLD